MSGSSSDRSTVPAPVPVEPAAPENPLGRICANDVAPKFAVTVGDETLFQKMNGYSAPVTAEMSIPPTFVDGLLDELLFQLPPFVRYQIILLIRSTATQSVSPFTQGATVMPAAPLTNVAPLST